MTYYQIHYPAAMPPPLLDEYLARGWYRMQQTIFTTDIIIKQETILPVFWLRLSLKKYRENKTSRKIIEVNRPFNIRLCPGDITDEAEALYQVYKAAMDFDLSDSIRDYLLGEALESIYATKRIEIRDGKKLIACGFYDEGANSLAGILNFYDPSYNKFTPGKYLMLVKIARALEEKKTYYYPGYISTAIPKFDYKLFPGKEASEVYLSAEGTWVPWLSTTRESLEQSLFSKGK